MPPREAPKLLSPDASLVARFMLQCLPRDPVERVMRGAAYKRFLRWCEDQKVEPLDAPTFWQHFDMRRRKFIAGVGAGVIARPFTTLAQQTGRVYRVALIFSTSPVSEMVGPDPINPSARVFVHALRDLGYVESQNLVLERRSAEGKFERFPEIIRELVSTKAEVIVTVTDPITLAAKEVTHAAPIVAIMLDPIQIGIENLARPGGNITGITGGTGSENFAKRVEVLKELLPGMSRVAFLQNRLENSTTWLEQGAEATERALGVKVLFAEQTDYAEAFAFIARERADALSVGGGGRNFANRHLIIEFAAKNRLPAIYQTSDYVAAGGLIAYGPDLANLYRRVAGYVDRILKGAKPADLPVERPTKFRLTINLKTAKALGLTLPPSLLARADEVIE
jgi:putative tryptophan/tyrosine transport system substrate-binding protein